MLDGRISKFLNTCRKRGECEYNSAFHRYEFSLVFGPMELEECALFVYPSSRRVRFVQSIEVFKGSLQTAFGEEDVFETEIRKDDDRRNLSSAEAARMIFADITAHDFDGVVSKSSLKLLD